MHESICLLSNQIGEKVIKHLISVSDKVVEIGLPKIKKLIQNSIL